MNERTVCFVISGQPSWIQNENMYYNVLPIHVLGPRSWELKAEKVIDVTLVMLRDPVTKELTFYSYDKYNIKLLIISITFTSLLFNGQCTIYN